MNYTIVLNHNGLPKAALGLSVPAATNSIMKLVELGILEEKTGQARNRLFAYTEYLDILTVGTEPLK